MVERLSGISDQIIKSIADTDFPLKRRVISRVRTFSESSEKFRFLSKSQEFAEEKLKITIIAGNSSTPVTYNKQQFIQMLKEFTQKHPREANKLEKVSPSALATSSDNERDSSTILPSLDPRSDPEADIEGTTVVVAEERVLESVPDAFWADISNFSAEDINEIVSVLHFHPVTVEDILSDHTRQKCEVFNSYLYVVLHCVGQYLLDDFSVLHLVLLENCVLSFSLAPIATVAYAMTRVLREMNYYKSSPNIASPFLPSSHHHVVEPWLTLLRPDWVLYFLTDRNVDDYVLPVESLDAEADVIDTLTENFSATERSEILTRIGVTRTNIKRVNDSLVAKREMLRRMLGVEMMPLRQGETPERSFAPHEIISAGPHRYLSDVFDHVVEMVNTLGSVEHALETSRSNYLTQVSLEMAEASNRMADQMRILSLVATVMLPMTLVAGLFGMNVEIPGQHIQGPYVFWGIVGTMIVSLCLFAYAVRRKDGISYPRIRSRRRYRFPTRRQRR